MEKHILFVLGIVIIAYVGMGGMLFQRIEQPHRSRLFDVLKPQSDLKPIAIFNTTQILAQRIAQLALRHLSTAPPKRQSILKRIDSNASTTPVPKNNPFDSLLFTSEELEDHVQFIVMQVAQFIIDKISPRNPLQMPLFNASTVTSPTSSEYQLVLTQAPQVFEDWDFYGSVFFAATTITTIGYGHISPQSEFGKMATVLYALIGIPLVAAFLGGLSDRIRRLAEKMQERVPIGNGHEKRRSRGSCSFCCIAMLKIVLVSLVGATVFIALPSFLFTLKEHNWSYIEALYFSFVTLSTIGFGDYIAARNPYIEGLDWYRIFVVVWILFGLAWLSSVIALIQAAITTYSAIAIRHVQANAYNYNIRKSVGRNDGDGSEDDGESADEERPKSRHRGRHRKDPGEASVFISSTSAGRELERKKMRTASLDREGESNDSSSEESFHHRKRSHSIRSSPSKRAPPVPPRNRSTTNNNNNQHHHNIQPMPNINSNYPGVVSIAAAATTSHQGDQYTVVGILPQMLQMASNMANSVMTTNEQQNVTPTTAVRNDQVRRITSNRQLSSLSGPLPGASLMVPVVSGGNNPGGGAAQQLQIASDALIKRLTSIESPSELDVASTSSFPLVVGDETVFYDPTKPYQTNSNYFDHGETTIQPPIVQSPVNSGKSRPIRATSMRLVSSSKTTDVPSTSQLGSGSLLPSLAEDQRYRRTKIQIHSSLSGSKNNKADPTERREQPQVSEL